MPKLYDFEVVSLIRNMRLAVTAMRDAGLTLNADWLDDQIDTLIRKVVSDVEVDPVPATSVPPPASAPAPVVSPLKTAA